MRSNTYTCCALLLVIAAMATLSHPAYAGSFEPTAACAGNADLLMHAVLQYAQDNETYLPPMDTPAHFRAAVGPFLSDQNDFICPETHKAYVPNASLCHV